MNKILISLGFSLFAISFGYTQPKPNVELKNLGTDLMESYYLVKASTSSSFPEVSIKNFKEQILSLSKTLKTRLDKNKTIVIKKIGTSNLKELESLIESYKNYSETNPDENELIQTSALTIINYASKSMVEEIFIKLNK